MLIFHCRPVLSTFRSSCLLLARSRHSHLVPLVPQKERVIPIPVAVADNDFPSHVISEDDELEPASHSPSLDPLSFGPDVRAALNRMEFSQQQARSLPGFTREILEAATLAFASTDCNLPHLCALDPSAKGKVLSFFQALVPRLDHVAPSEIGDVLLAACPSRGAIDVAAILTLCGELGAIHELGAIADSVLRRSQVQSLEQSMRLVAPGSRDVGRSPATTTLTSRLFASLVVIAGRCGCNTGPYLDVLARSFVDGCVSYGEMAAALSAAQGGLDANLLRAGETICCVLQRHAANLALDGGERAVRLWRERAVAPLLLPLLKAFAARGIFSPVLLSLAGQHAALQASCWTLAQIARWGLYLTLLCGAATQQQSGALPMCSESQDALRQLVPQLGAMLNAVLWRSESEVAQLPSHDKACLWRVVVQHRALQAAFPPVHKRSIWMSDAVSITRMRSILQNGWAEYEYSNGAECKWKVNAVTALDAVAASLSKASVGERAGVRTWNETNGFSLSPLVLDISVDSPRKIRLQDGGVIRTVATLIDDSRRVPTVGGFTGSGSLLHPVPYDSFRHSHLPYVERRGPPVYFITILRSDLENLPAALHKAALLKKYLGLLERIEKETVVDVPSLDVLHPGQFPSSCSS